MNIRENTRKPTTLTPPPWKQLSPHTRDPSFLSSVPKRARKPLHSTLGEGEVPGLPWPNINQYSMQPKIPTARYGSTSILTSPGRRKMLIASLLSNFQRSPADSHSGLPEARRYFPPARLITHNFAVWGTDPKTEIHINYLNLANLRWKGNRKTP